MNLQKLFETQKILDDRINTEHPPKEGEDRLAKKILALQVELGELANEWRGFKFWSKNQGPRDEVYTSTRDDRKSDYLWCGTCHDKFSPTIAIESDTICPKCEDNYLIGFKKRNPMLEEYVDCLHFILSIGLELKINVEAFFGITFSTYPHDKTETFVYLNRRISDIFESVRFETGEEYHYYRIVFKLFIGLGVKLGLTTEEIEQAYMNKNEVNHQRQEDGY